MARNDRTTAGPFWTRNWIEKMWRFTAENFVDFDTGSVDFEALGREEYEFRKALFYRKFKNSTRAKEAFEESNALYMVNVERGKKGGRPRKETTADGDTREGSLNESYGISAVDLESTTSANHYGEAATSDGADVSTTFSDISQDAPNGNAGDESLVHPAPNMRRVPQNEAPAHGFSGGRTAQGTMSRSPEAAAQSGKDSTLDSRTDKDGQPNRRTVAPSTGATSSTATVRSYRPRKVPHPKGDYEVFDFASENGIPDWVASEFYQRFFVERDGVDTDGNRIDNWKGALINYNKSRKRETA